MSLYMKDGEIKLDLRIGTGRLKTGVSKQRSENKYLTQRVNTLLNRRLTFSLLYEEIIQRL